MTRARRYLPAAVAFVAVLALWEGLLRLFDVQSFVLAKPSEIATAFVENFSVIWGAGLRTLVEAVGGLLIGVVLGVAVALAAARWVSMRQGLVPDRHGGERHPHHRLGPDHEPVVHHHQPGLEDDGGVGDGVLPGDGQHPARASPRSTTIRSR